MPDGVELLLPGSAFAGVTRGPDGRYYGVTYDGGNNNKGTLYSFDPWLQSIQVHHHFDGATTGSTPYGELTFDPDTMNLYGSTHNGGPGNAGTIFVFNPGANGLATLRSDFEGYTSPRGSLVISQGYLYGTVVYTNGAVYRMNKDGTGFAIIHALADFSSLPGPVTLGQDGMLYGTTVYGGIHCNANNSFYGCGTLFRLKPVLPGDTDEQFASLLEFQFGNGTPCPSPLTGNCINRANYPQGNLVWGSDGLLYGTTFYSVFKANPANVPGTIQFLTPSNTGISIAVAEGGDQRLYVADYTGGAEGAGQVYSIKRDGTDRKDLRVFSFVNGSKAYGPYGRLWRDAFGMVLGTTEYTIGGTEHGVLFTKQSTGPLVNMTVNVTIAGSGSGKVTSAAPGIDCAPACAATFNNFASVTLNAAPTNAGSVFTGWLGPCTGRATSCVISAAGVHNVKAAFAPNNVWALKLDADENNGYDALTDGLLFIRYMFGLTGDALTSGVVGGGAGLATPAQILQHLEDIQPLLDADGNGKLEVLYDGVLIFRYLNGFRGANLIADAVANDATRKTAAAIESYLASVLP